jgi:hypothetical protein
MDPQPQTVAACPSCGGPRHANILAEEHLREEGDVFGPEWELTKYRILNCRGFGTRFFQTVATNADDLIEERDENGEKVRGTVPRETIKYYPTFSRRGRPDWSKGVMWTEHQKLRNITDEMYAALDNELPVLAAIGMRTVFDTAIEILGIDPGGTFKEKLDAILSLGKISQEERNYLDALVDAGSAAVHRGWRPESWHLDTMALILEGFLHRAFVLPSRASSLRGAPLRPKSRSA